MTLERRQQNHVAQPGMIKNARIHSQPPSHAGTAQPNDPPALKHHDNPITTQPLPEIERLYNGQPRTAKGDLMTKATRTPERPHSRRVDWEAGTSNGESSLSPSLDIRSFGRSMAAGVLDEYNLA